MTYFIEIKNFTRFQPEEDSMAEDPDAIPSLQLAWEMIELARVIYKARDEVNFELENLNYFIYLAFCSFILEII